MATETDYTRKCQQLDVLIDLLEKENKRRAEEIVHCEECKYSSHVCGDIYRCEWWRENGVGVYTGDFCSNGEREVTE
jgi:hypothetical protein